MKWAKPHSNLGADVETLVTVRSRPAVESPVETSWNGARAPTLSTGDDRVWGPLDERSQIGNSDRTALGRRCAPLHVTCTIEEVASREARVQRDTAVGGTNRLKCRDAGRTRKPSQLTDALRLPRDLHRLILTASPQRLKD